MIGRRQFITLLGGTATRSGTLARSPNGGLIVTTSGLKDSDSGVRDRGSSQKSLRTCDMRHRGHPCL